MSLKKISFIMAVLASISTTLWAAQPATGVPREKKPVKAYSAHIAGLSISPIRSGFVVKGRIKAGRALSARSDLLYLRLLKGKELWSAESFPAPNTLKDKWDVFAAPVRTGSIPAGQYSARICIHGLRCVSCPELKVQVTDSSHSHTRPMGWGTFIDSNGTPHRWHINQAGTLIWNGKPYIPVGGMYLSPFFMGYNLNDLDSNEGNWKADITRLAQLKAAGITDIYMNPCSDWFNKPLWLWQRMLDLFEEMGFNYGLQINHPTKQLKGYHIATGDYLVKPDGLKASADIVSSFFGKAEEANSVMYAAWDKNGNVKFGRARVTPITNGVHAEVELSEPAEVVHFIPELTFQGDMHDYWTGVDDNYREDIKKFIGALRPGPGFRCFIDPLDNEQCWRDMHRMLPASPAFHNTLMQHLKKDYTDEEALAKAWAVEPAPSFEEAARLVPIGAPSVDSKTGWAVDPETEKVFTMDLTSSKMWHDIIRIRDWSIRDYNNLVSNWIKEHHNVPVVLKVMETDSFTNNLANGGFDGVGMEAYGSAPGLVRGCGGGVFSRAQRAGRTMWEIVTETGMATPTDDFVGYPDPIRMTNELASMAEMGAKGIYYFYLNAGGDAPGNAFYCYNLFCDERQLWWLGAFSKMMKQSDKLKDYLPNIDYYFPGMIAGQEGFYAPHKDFSGDIPSQSIKGQSGRWVVPATTTPPPGSRIIVNMENRPATLIYGPAVDEWIKKGSHEVVFVGHRRDLGRLMVDSYYTEEFSTDENGGLFQVLKPSPTSHVFGKTQEGKVFCLKDGNLVIYSKDDWLSCVREMAGPASSVDFIRDVMGAKIPDMGITFQGLAIGDETWVWNMTDRLNPFGQAVPEGDTIKKIEISPLPKAAHPEVVKNVKGSEFIGVNEANLTTAVDEWDRAREKAAAAGINASVVPPGTNWQEIHQAAEKLRRDVEFSDRTANAVKMATITTDGDMFECKDMKPLTCSIQVKQDTSTPYDYKDAEFFTGWNEEGVYIAGKIKDEAMVNRYKDKMIWNGDCIEIFIDLQPDLDPFNAGYLQGTYQFLISPTNIDGVPDAAVFNPSLSSDYKPKQIKTGVKKTDSGWQFECFMPSSELGGWRPHAGESIGFTLSLDDSDAGDRSAQYMWKGKGDACRNRTRFGRLVFAE